MCLCWTVFGEHRHLFPYFREQSTGISSTGFSGCSAQVHFFTCYALLCISFFSCSNGSTMITRNLVVLSSSLNEMVKFLIRSCVSWVKSIQKKVKSWYRSLGALLYLLWSKVYPSTFTWKEKKYIHNIYHSVFLIQWALFVKMCLPVDFSVQTLTNSKSNKQANVFPIIRSWMHACVGTKTLTTARSRRMLDRVYGPLFQLLLEDSVYCAIIFIADQT